MNYNDGTALTVQSGVSIHMDDMGFTNKSNGAFNGSIDNDGDIYVEGDWYNNASSGIVFTKLNSNGTTHFKGSLEQDVGGSLTTTFESLEINNSSSTGVILAKPITVNIALALTDGYLYTDATNLITLIDNATSSSGSVNSFVDGPFKKVGNDAFIFPLGNVSKWARLGITAPSSSSIFTAQYTKSAYSDITNVGTLNNVSAVEFWELNRNSGTGSIVPTLYWENGTESWIDDLSDLTVARYNGSNWVDETQSGGTTGSTSSGTITARSISSFGAITFGSGVNNSNPLPIELISFEAVLNERQVDLDWITASETNNDYFTIERSRDGNYFESLFHVPGAGNSNSLINYNETDYSPITGQSFYRLKQTDYNGQFDFSGIVGIYNQNQLRDGVLIFPNPVLDGNVQIQLENNVPQLKIDIRDMLGRLVYKDDFFDVEKSESIRINLAENLSKGTYIVTTDTGRDKKENKIIVN